MRGTKIGAAVLATFVVGVFAQSAEASKVAFTGSSPKSFSGTNSGSHIFTATGTGGQLRVTCTSATFTGSATLGATSVTTQPTYSGCTSLYGGAQFATTVTCGTFTIGIANTTVLGTGAVADGGSPFGNVTLNPNGCDIRINANCTLNAKGGPYRFNADGHPANNANGATAPSTTPNGVQLYAKVNGITVGTKSGSNCTAFGFAASPATVSNGQYFGTNNTAASSTAPASNGNARVDVSGIWASN